MSWDLLPGQHIERSELHARFGGRIHPRISPSKTSPNIMLFLTPTAAASCFDGWTGEHVHFGGEGGLDGRDQSLTQGNGSIFRHEEEGRALRLFLQPEGEPAQYVGQYRLDPQMPFVHADAPADPRRPLEVRRAIVFRLLPLNGTPTGLPVAAPVAREREVRRVDPGTARGSVLGRIEPSPAQRGAARLLLRYEAYARWAHQAELTGFRIRAFGAVTALHVDLFDLTCNELVVARASCARAVVWEALGELHDLARFFTPTPRRVLLLPCEPDADLTELLLTQHVTAAWPCGARDFARTAPVA